MKDKESRKRQAHISMLSDETVEMEREQRHREKRGHRSRFKIRVQERDKATKALHREQLGLEGQRQHHVKKHAWLDSPRLDGVAPEMSINAEDYPVEFENVQRDQELEYKLRNGLINAPKFNPKPGGP